MLSLKRERPRERSASPPASPPRSGPGWQGGLRRWTVPHCVREQVGLDGGMIANNNMVWRLLDRFLVKHHYVACTEAGVYRNLQPWVETAIATPSWPGWTALAKAINKYYEDDRTPKKPGASAQPFFDELAWVTAAVAGVPHGLLNKPLPAVHGSILISFDIQLGDNTARWSVRGDAASPWAALYESGTGDLLPAAVPSELIFSAGAAYPFADLYWRADTRESLASILRDRWDDQVEELKCDHFLFEETVYVTISATIDEFEMCGISYGDGGDMPGLRDVSPEPDASGGPAVTLPMDGPWPPQQHVHVDAPGGGGDYAFTV